MQIAKHKVVTIDYTLTDDEGNVLDQSTGGHFAYLHGEQNIIPGLEDALAGKARGDRVSVSVPPEAGYGERDESKAAPVPRNMFPDDMEIEPGMQFQAQGPNGETLLVTVVRVAEEEIVVDGNHPLAGMNLNFDVEIMEVRDATTEEVSHGHVHGPDDHHHH